MLTPGFFAVFVVQAWWSIVLEPAKAFAYIIQHAVVYKAQQQTL